MKLSLIIITAVLIFWTVGCSAPAPTPTPTLLPKVTPTPILPLTSTPTPTATPTPVVVAPTAFFLKVTAPPNESVVTTTALQVAGETTPDAVVTVNGQIVEVDANGRFQVTLSLAQGPNVIEVAASDFSGKQAQELRTVILAQ